MDEESKKMFQDLLSDAVDLGKKDLLMELLRAARELEAVAIDALDKVREKISMLQTAIKEIEDKDQVKIPFEGNFPKDGDKVEINI